MRATTALLILATLTQTTFGCAAPAEPGGDELSLAPATPVRRGGEADTVGISSRLCFAGFALASCVSSPSRFSDAGAPDAGWRDDGGAPVDAGDAGRGTSDAGDTDGGRATVDAGDLDASRVTVDAGDPDASPSDAGPRTGCGDGFVDGAELCDGDTISCVGLARSFSAGDAACRADCRGYDVRSCTQIVEPTRAEVVKPAERDARWASARCNDGSPFAFTVRLSPTGSTTWVVSLMGGGWCEDAGAPCSARLTDDPALTRSLGSADRASTRATDRGLHSVDAIENPDFHDANHVRGHYCSSDGWLGDSDARRPTTGDPVDGWYFSGRVNARAMFETIAQRFGLADTPATRVVFFGTSAGAIGIPANARALAEQIPGVAADGRLRVIIDGGWVPIGWDDPGARWNGIPASDRQIGRDAADFWGAGFEPLCEADAVHPGDCVFAVNNYGPLSDPPPGGLGLPVLVQESLQDTAFVASHGIEGDTDRLDTLETMLLAELADVPWLFVSDQPYHTITHRAAWTLLGDPDASYRDMVGDFVAGEPAIRIVHRP